MRDAAAGASLLQSLAETDHRDRFNHHHANHRNHEYLHRRQVDAVLDVDAIVASVTSTISVIQDIEIDSNGNTITIQTWLATSTSVEALDDSTVAAPTTAYATTAFSSPSPPAPPAAAPSTSSTLGPLNTELINNQPTTAQSPLSVPTSQSVPLPLTSPPFLSSNSSTSTGSLSLSSSTFTSFSSNLSNHTSSTSLVSSSSGSSTSRSTSSEISTSLSSTWSKTKSYDSSNSATPTIAGGIGVGGGPGATSSSSATSTPVVGAAGGASDTGASSSTPAVVGGVVGGIAGIAFIVALLMFLVRWRKRQLSILRLNDSPSTGPRAIGGTSGGPSQMGGMTDRSLPFAIPTALANLTGYQRTSQQTSVEASSTAGSERGFYRVSGRKLPSVLQHGGDGYGGGHEARHESLSGSSFYRDSRGFYGGPGSPTSPGVGRDSGIPIARPSPARTPVISEGAFGPPSAAPLPPMDPPRRPDALGRSHPSRDGSHTSRFTEEV